MKTNCIIIISLTKEMSRILNEFDKNHPDFIYRNLNGQKKQNSSEAVKFYKDNGLVLTYIAGLMEKYPFDLEVCGAEKINKAHLPNVISKGSIWLADNKHRKLKDVAKNIGITNEELSQFKLDAKVPVHSIKEEIIEMRKKTKEKNKAFSNEI